ncbi:NAD-dependent epimerase/dehydratase family protein [uncultured Ruminococcus sp.]|uniref:NAD-dependent epimerase/dehydratase family protein n=1 Tax=uncultured Ruminococcus sp. TaxID=165186 RepID=UPI00292E4D1D|nr:NAD-dependent epimerase/dehydratase family protein [uncultured Ruminococcus sp.]
MAYKVQDCVKKSIYTNLLDIAEAPISWDKLRGKTLLLTGAGGFIGYYMTCGILLRNDLYGDNIKVLALERFGDFARKRFGHLLERDDVELIEQDITVPIQAERADFVIHAASQASNIEFERDPVGTISANLGGTVNALNYAKDSGAEAALVVSSLKVYGALHTGKPYIEEDDTGYVDFTSYKSCYAVGKRAAETIAASYIKEYGMNVRIVRPSYIFGASRLDDDRVWAQFIANIVRGQDILLKSNGATNRSFCYVTDTVTAMLHVLLDGENGVPYNISNEASNTTIRGFAQAACEVFPERNMKLAFANPEDEIMPEPSPNDPTPEIMDNKRIRSIGWEPKVDLKEGIRRAVAILEEA